MIRKLLCAIALSGSFLAVNSQKVIDSLASESCDCFENFLEKSKLPVEDSLTNCITFSIVAHFETLKKEKKLNPGTVEGIREIHARVRKTLKKKCRVFTGKVQPDRNPGANKLPQTI